MKFYVISFAFIGILAVSGPASADSPKNLKVLDPNIGKDLGKGMKELTKGLGVKCEACHEKGKFESDSVKTKDDGRTFLTKVVGVKDEAARKAALTELLKALKLEAVKSEPAVWTGVDLFKKKT